MPRNSQNSVALQWLRGVSGPLIASLLVLSAVGQTALEPLPPVPSPQQLAWQELEFIAFAHFGINTFTDREWGDGTEDPALFNPSAFDARQWVQALKDAGGRLLILTCKHHDGFCLWPSAFTEHSVKNSPWKGGTGDIVAEVAEACREAGIKFGVYLSPWDRHELTYGDSPRYNQYFLSQLRELLTNYGEVAEVWFDGACGEGPNGKRQVYDFEAYYSLIRELQPNAVIAIMGPDVRWVGNESGVARETEWSVKVVSPDAKGDPRTAFNPTLCEGSPAHLLEGAEGSSDVALSQLSADPGEAGGTAPLIWYPAECDVSIRPGWFYHASQDDRVKSLEHLLDIYYKSAGRNSVLLLNIPPDRRGLFHENDVQRLKELRQVLDATFKRNLAATARAQASSTSDGFGITNLFDTGNKTCWAAAEGESDAEIEIDLQQPQTFDVAMLREPIALGQRIAGFTIDAQINGRWKTLAEGTTIGYRQLVRFPVVTAQKLRLRVTKSRATPLLSTFALYKQPPVVSIQPDGSPFTDSVTVELSADSPGAEIHYTLDGSEPSESSPTYTGPWTLTETAHVRAKARGGFLTSQALFQKCTLLEPVMAANPFPGLNYTYYEGGWQTLDDMPRAKAVESGHVDRIGIEVRKRDDHFALEFSGFVRAPREGIYTFYISSDDGSRLFIHDRQVIGHDGLHGMTERSGHIGLGGGLHPITIQYFNATGGMGLEVSYAGPGIEKRPIPTSALMRVNLER